MSLRESLAVGWAPIFLRLALGVTFMWAGLAKVVYRADFAGQDAATLANYGVIAAPSAAAPPTAEIDPIAFIPRAQQDEQDEQDQPPPPTPPLTPDPTTVSPTARRRQRSTTNRVYKMPLHPLRFRKT